MACVWSVSYTHLDVYKRQIQDMLTEGIMEPSSSAWSPTVVLVAKKGGGLRIFVDYRRLNYVTKKYCYPLPRVDDTLDTLSGAQWFS